MTNYTVLDSGAMSCIACLNVSSGLVTKESFSKDRALLLTSAAAWWRCEASSTVETDTPGTMICFHIYILDSS